MRKDLVNPPKLLKKNPFLKNSKKKYKQTGICAVVPINSKKYKLKTFSSSKYLPKNAYITHYGKCGACSSLQDLAVYKKNHNLTKSMKRCALKGMVLKRWNNKCVKNLGFSDTCSQIWFYNSQNTLKKCWIPCLKHYFSKNNLSKNKLNPCLQCDEDVNGMTFKKFAGRTRRNSGIKSSIQRAYISKIRKSRKRKSRKRKSRKRKSRKRKSRKRKSRKRKSRKRKSRKRKS